MEPLPADVAAATTVNLTHGAYESEKLVDSFIQTTETDDTPEDSFFFRGGGRGGTGEGAVVRSASTASTYSSTNTVDVWTWWAGKKNWDATDPYCRYPPSLYAKLSTARDVAQETQTVQTVDMAPELPDYVVVFDPSKEDPHYRVVQQRKDNPKRFRFVIPLTVGWYWNSANGDARRARWDAFTDNVMQQLEEAYAKRIPEVTLNVAVPGDPDQFRRFEIAGYPFYQYDATDKTKKRQLRRLGPELHSSTSPILLLSSKAGKPCIAPALATIKAPYLENIVNIAPFQVLFDRTWVYVPGGDKGYGCADGKTGSPAVRATVVRVERIHVPKVAQRYWWKMETIRQRNQERGGVDTKYVEQHLKKVDVATTTWCEAHPDLLLDTPLQSDVHESLLFHGTADNVVGYITQGENACAEVRMTMDLTGDSESLVVGTNTERFAKHTTQGRGVYLADVSSKSNKYIPCPSCGFNMHRVPRRDRVQDADLSGLPRECQGGNKHPITWSQRSIQQRGVFHLTT